MKRAIFTTIVLLLLTSPLLGADWGDDGKQGIVRKGWIIASTPELAWEATMHLNAKKHKEVADIYQKHGADIFIVQNEFEATIVKVYIRDSMVKCQSDADEIRALFNNGIFWCVIGAVETIP